MTSPAMSPPSGKAIYSVLKIKKGARNLDYIVIYTTCIHINIDE